MISIVIPAYNESAHLPATLRGVHGAFTSVAPEVAYEIVVCDNNSTDDTAAVATAHGARVVFEPHNQIARARNTGAREARGEWIVFLDADSQMPAPLLREMLAHLAGDKIQGGGAPVRFDTARLRWGPTLVVAAWNRVSRLAKLAAGSFIFCRRADWESVGGFDESFYAGEEINFSQKLKRQLSSRGKRFAILSTPVPTSARKIEWNSDWQLLKLIPLALKPSAWKSREACAFWYQRPLEKPPT